MGDRQIHPVHPVHPVRRFCLQLRTLFRVTRDRLGLDREDREKSQPPERETIRGWIEQLERQGVPVLNINELANSVKAVLLPGETVGVRGPFGRGVPLDEFRGRDVLIVAGGIGLVPMRSMINYVIDRRDHFGRLIICYGSRSDNELLFTDELLQWAADPDGNPDGQLQASDRAAFRQAIAGGEGFDEDIVSEQ